MKRYKFSVLTIVILALAMGSVYTQDTENEFTATQELIESKQFEFHAEQVIPMSGSSKNIATDNYTITVLKDSVNSYLPYYGRAYRVDFSREGGMIFEGDIIEYSSTVNEKKERIMVEFTVKDGNDEFKCTFTIQKNGSTSLTINSINRQSITYWGKVRKTNE